MTCRSGALRCPLRPAGQWLCTASPRALGGLALDRGSGVNQVGNALSLDRDDDHTQEAAAAYEELLAVDATNLEALLNLVVLYWQATNSGTSFPVAFLKHAGARTHELLRLAGERCPNSPAVKFWQKYIAWAELGEPFDVEECRRILRIDPQYTEPAFYLLSQNADDDVKPLAQGLLDSQGLRCDGSTPLCVFGHSCVLSHSGRTAAFTSGCGEVALRRGCPTSCRRSQSVHHNTCDQDF